MDDLIKTCRHCKTAFNDTFPRVNCACGKNEPEPSPVPEPSPAGDYSGFDLYGYDVADQANPTVAQAKRRNDELNDPLVWWL